MTNTYFFTGFPGFLATSLIKQMVRDEFEIEHFYLLVLPGQIEKAKQEIAAIAAAGRIAADKFTVVEGDITKPKLNISDDFQEMMLRSVTHVFHLAAIYDLAVPKDIAYNVNVIGTKHVNEWVLTLKNIRRYVYFSTAYVSGLREGRILETELEMNQAFKNHYERTKYEAELLVRQMIDKVPTTVIRPGVVKGHAKTGETIKFDGPYFMLNFFDRLRFLPFIPFLGSGKAPGNFVPVDYIFEAALYLAHAETGAGKTYHLADPKPYRMKEVYAMLMHACLGRQPKGMVPLFVAKLFLSFPFIRKWLQVEKQALDYFTCMAEHDCTNARRDLEGSGIGCPDFKETIKPMIEFYEKHKHDREKQLQIR